MKNQLNKLLVLSIISVIVSVGTLIYFIDTLPKKPTTNVIAEDVEVVPVKSNLAVIKTVASIDQSSQDLLTSTSIVTDTKDEDNTDNKVEGTSESNGWHDHNLKLLFQYKDHKFYTVK